MAARLNTKFLFILITVLVAVAIGVAGIAYFALRKDPTRNLKRAEAAIARAEAARARNDQETASGELRAASEQLSRAVAKRTGDLDILARWEEVVLQLRAQNPDHAREDYLTLIRILGHRVLIDPQNLQAHVDQLEEIMLTARLMSDWWDVLASQAETSLARFSEGTKEHDTILAYKLMADARRMTRLNEDQVMQLEREFGQYVEDHPDDARAAAFYVNFLIARGQRAYLEKHTIAANEYLASAEAAYDPARERSPRHLELAVTGARHALLTRVVRPEAVTEEDLRAAGHALAEALPTVSDPILYNDAVVLMPALLGSEGRTRMIALLETQLDPSTEPLLERWYLASLHYEAGNLDQTKVESERIIQSQPLTTGLLAWYRFVLQQEAAMLIFHAERERLGQLGTQPGATAEQVAAQLEQMKKARHRIAEMVGHRDDDLNILECDAWLALAEKNPRVAAAKFNRVIAGSEVPDLRVMWAYARALRETGATGEAHRFLLETLEKAPDNVQLLLEITQLEAELNLFDEATEHAETILALDPTNTRARAILDQIAMYRNISAPVEDDITRISQESLVALREGDYDTARAILIEGLERHPDSLPVFEALVRTELVAGMTEEAIARLEEYDRKYPNHPKIIELLEMARGTDPIDVQKRIAEARFADSEIDQAASLYVNLRALARQEEVRAESLRRAGQSAEAEKASDVAQRAHAEADRYADRAEALLSESHPRFPEYLDQRLRDALAARDYAAAERVSETARQTNADQARGLLFVARVELAQGEFENAIITLSDAADAKPYDPWIWRTLGFAYMRIGNLIDAKRSFESALERRPNDIETVQQYGPLLVQTGDLARALELYKSAAQRYRTSSELEEQWLVLEAMAGNPLVAFERRRQRYQDDPSDRINAVRLASLLGTLQPTRELMLGDDGRPTYSAREWDLLPAEERAKAIGAQRSQWIAVADGIFKKLVADAPEDIDVIAAHAGYQRDTGRSEEGRNALTALAERPGPQQKNPALYLALAQYLVSINDREAAANWLERGLASQADDTREIDLALAGLYSEMGRFEDAHRHMLRVAEVNPGRDVQMQLIEQELQLQRFDEAQARLEKLMRTAQDDHILWLLKSGVTAARAYEHLARGRTGEAERMFAQQMQEIERAISLSTTQPMPYVVKARAILDRFRRMSPPQFSLLDDALAATERGLERSAGFVPALQLRANIMLQRQPADHMGAVAELTKILERAPRDTETRMRAVDLCVAGDRLARAVDLVEEAIELEPSQPMWHRALGELHARAGDARRAASAYRAAFAISRTPQDAVAWADLQLAEGSPASAREVINEFSRMVDQFANAPALQNSLALALAADGRWNEAVAQLREAYTRYRALVAREGTPAAVDPWLQAAARMYEARPASEFEQFIMEVTGGRPSFVELHRVGLAWLFREADGATRALEIFNRAYEQTTEGDVTGRAIIQLFIGQTHLRLGNYEAARDAYEAVIELQPDHPQALNNVAYIYAVHLDDPATALGFAERAVRLVPNSPNYLDTLGVVYLKMGRLEDAADRLNQALQLNGRAAGIHVHLAQVLLAQNRAGEARAHLDRARNLNPDTETQAEIDRLLDDMTH